MGRKASTIRRLPDELRKEIDRLLVDGRYTLSDVTNHMRSLGAEVSRSAVARYSQDFERVADDIRLAREMANAIGRELDAAPEGDSGRLVIESLQALLLRARMQLTDGKDEIDVDEFAKLSRAAKDLASALKFNVDTELKVKQALELASSKVEKVAAASGISAGTIEAIKASILGVQRSA